MGWEVAVVATWTWKGIGDEYEKSKEGSLDVAARR